MPNIRGHYYLWPAGVKFSISIPISISHSIGWGKNAPFKLALNPNAHAHVPLRIDFYAPSPLSIIKNSFGLLSWQTGPLRYATKMHIIKKLPKKRRGETLRALLRDSFPIKVT